MSFIRFRLKLGNQEVETVNILFVPLTQAYTLAFGVLFTRLNLGQRINFIHFIKAWKSKALGCEYFIHLVKP